jgi:hypothetical protein
MKVEQISIFLENKSGRLAEVTRVLRDANINIRALSIADTSDFGILRIIVNDCDKAADVLKVKNFTLSKTEVLAVEVLDRPGGLAQILELLEQDNINVEYMYAFLERSSDNAVIIFRFDEMEKATQILASNGVTILDSSKVYNL